MAEPDCSDQDHSYRSKILSNLRSKEKPFTSSSTAMKFQEQFVATLPFPSCSEEEPGSQEDCGPDITKASVAPMQTLHFEKIFSVVEKMLYDASQHEEIKEDEPGPSKSEVQYASFRSRFKNSPLYQDYCLQDVREDFQRFKGSSLSNLIPHCVQGFKTQLEHLSLSENCPPQRSPETVSATEPPLSNPIKVRASSLWQELEEVKGSGLLQHLDPKEIRLHETSYELIRSEASYFRSLEVTVKHFFASNTLRQTLTQMQHHILFSNIDKVMAASAKLLKDLELRLGESILIGALVADVVLEHCPAFHRLYVPYVTNMMYQEALMMKLEQQNKDFQSVVAQLEKSPICQRQNLRSFLVLPFQRITRIKLLLQTIFKLTKPESDSLMQLEQAIQAVHEVVQECDDRIQKMKQIEELVCLEMQLDFGKVKSIPVVVSGRFLMHQGPVQQLSLETPVQSRMLFTNIYLHLLSDLLIISSKRDERFEVMDHAEFPTHIRCEDFKPEVLGLPPNSFLLHLSKRLMGPAVVLVLLTDSQMAKEKWMKALSSKE